MASVNKVILVGNLGQDPEVRYTPSGDAVVNLSLATTDKYKDKNGEPQEATEWHRVSFFGRLAEICGEYLKKGSQVYVEGSLRTRKWQDKEGNDRYTTEIRGDRMQMLGGTKDRSSAPTGGAAEYAKASGKEAPKAEPRSGSFADMEDDIPFMRIGRVASMVA